MAGPDAYRGRGAAATIVDMIVISRDDPVDPEA